MEGLPVIPRADGTVGDVGTSWWTTRVGEKNIARDFGIAAIEAEAIPDEFFSHIQTNCKPYGYGRWDKTRLEEACGSMNHNLDGCGDVSVADRVAFVDQGMFPEKRTVSNYRTRMTGSSRLMRSTQNLAMIRTMLRAIPLKLFRLRPVLRRRWNFRERRHVRLSWKFRLHTVDLYRTSCCGR